MAQTYHIYDMSAFSLSYIASLAVGLPDNSRTKLKMAGQKVSTETMLLAIIADGVQFLCWAKTDDGANGINRPESIYNAITGNSDSSDRGDIQSFDTAEEFEEYRNSIINNSKEVIYHG